MFYAFVFYYMDNTMKIVVGIIIAIAAAFGFFYWIYSGVPATAPAAADTEQQLPAVAIPALPQSGGGFDTISIPPTPDGKG